MSDVYIPQRLTVERAQVVIRTTPFDVVAGEVVYELLESPSSFQTGIDPENEAVILYGPAVRVTINDPFGYVNHTAGADAGDHNVRTRRGTWSIVIDAMADTKGRDNYFVDDPVGDARFSELLGRIVDVIVWAHSDISESLFIPVVAGSGLCQDGRIEMNSQDGDPLIRNLRIIRHSGQVAGGLTWGDMESFAWGVPA